MKVLHVLKSKIFSGAENVATGIIKNMPEDVESVYLSADGPIVDKLQELGIKYIAVPEVTVDVIKKTIAQVEPDIIHSHDFSCGLMCAKATDSIPVISHLHSNPGWISKIDPRSITYGGACKSFAKIITVSASVEKEAWFRDKMKGKTLCLGNPFSARTVFEKGYRPFQELSPDKLNALKSDLLFVGRLQEEKNPLEFINIVAELKKTYPQVKAIMVGTGDLGGKCLKQIDKLRLEDNIHMVGFQSNPYSFMNMTRVLVMPSKYEGFGLVALEAMTFGKPVLGSRVGGLQEIITSDCGAVCATDKNVIDRPTFVSEAVRLLGEEDYYESKSKGAKKKAKAYDNYDSYMSSIYDIYQELLNNKN